MSKGERRGCIRLKDAFVGYDNEDDITFTINTIDEKTFHLQAKNLAEREKWVSKIERTIHLHSSNEIRVMRANSKTFDGVNEFVQKKNMSYKISTSSYDDETSNESNHGFNMSDIQKFQIFNKIENNLNFDSSIVESDGYLQLLVEKLKVNVLILGEIK